MAFVDPVDAMNDVGRNLHFLGLFDAV